MDLSLPHLFRPISVLRRSFPYSFALPCAALHFTSPYRTALRCVALHPSVPPYTTGSRPPPFCPSSIRTGPSRARVRGGVRSPSAMDTASRPGVDLEKELTCSVSSLPRERAIRTHPRHQTDIHRQTYTRCAQHETRLDKQRHTKTLKVQSTMPGTTADPPPPPFPLSRSAPRFSSSR